MSLADVRLLCLDFDGVITTNRVRTHADGSESVESWRSDGIGIEAVKALGVNVVVVSREKSPIVTVRCDKLGIPAFQAVQDKADVVRKLALSLSVPLEQVAFVGNDTPDMPALDIVGEPWIVADAHKSMRSNYRMLEERGGDGAVRELCDRIVEAKRA